MAESFKIVSLNEKTIKCQKIHSDRIIKNFNFKGQSQIIDMNKV